MMLVAFPMSSTGTVATRRSITVALRTVLMVLMHQAERRGRPQAGDDGPVLEVRGLRFAWGARRGRACGRRAQGRRALRQAGAALFSDVNLTVRSGEIVVLRGPNGSGKTTLLRLIAGARRPTAGSIDVRAGRRLSYVPQNPEHLFVAYTVRDELAQALESGLSAGRGLSVGRGRTGRDASENGNGPTHENGRGENGPMSEDGTHRSDNHRSDSHRSDSHRSDSHRSDNGAGVEVLARRFGLAHLLDANPFELSAGQKRRVNIAVVAASAPSLVLLDEPTFGLDGHGTAVLAYTLGVLRRDGAGMLVVTHDDAFAESIADRTVALREGRLV